MAKDKSPDKPLPGTELQTTPATDEITDLATIGDMVPVADRPKSLSRTDLSGTEDIGPNDVRFPRLAIAQGLSPQITPGDQQHIKGLELFDMFNDLTGEIYGKGPITFVPIRRDVRRIEFRPRSEGGGVLDMDVPLNDPRLNWTPENPQTGEPRKPPRATTFVEFVIVLIRPGHEPEPIVLSIKGTNKHNRRASDQLTTFIKARQAAIYTGMYTVDTSVPAKNDKGTFGVPRVVNAGFVPKDTPRGAAFVAWAKQFHDQMEGKTIVVDREQPTDTDFDTAEMERDTSRETSGVGQTGTRDL